MSGKGLVSVAAARVRALLADRRGLAAVLLLAVVLRLAWLAFGVPGSLSHDEIGYRDMATQFNGSGFLGYYSDEPTAFVTPGYPLFLATVFRFVSWGGGSLGAQVAAVRAIQTVLGIVVVALAYEIGRRVFRDGRVAVLAAVFAAVYPSSLMAQMRLLTEATFAFLFVGWALASLVLMERRTLALHAASGALLGVTVLVRPSVALLMAVVYAVDFVLRRDRRFLAGMLVALISFSVVMSPWWVRNAVVFDRFVPFATQGGNPVLRGTDPYDPYDREGPSIIEGVSVEEMGSVAIERVRTGLGEDPALWIGWFTYGKTWYLWGWPWAVDPFISTLVHWIVMLGLGVPGLLWGAWRFARGVRGREAGPVDAAGAGWIVLSLVLVWLMQLAFIPIPRYLYPFMPLVGVMGASFAVGVLDRWRLRSSMAPAAPAKSP